jgi:hydroxymethylglutaryl-CoA synthase
MKGAIRHLALDGAGGQAIVVCADIAEYARGSSGEPTQGAGAVAMLLEEDPKLAIVDLPASGSASDYRIMDFRKPMSRFCGQNRAETHQVQDFPVFNGKYSTTCYVDEVLAAARHLFERAKQRPSELLRGMKATFLHRPYQRMAETGLAFTFLLALAMGDGEDLQELARIAQGADVDPNALADELVAAPDVYQLVTDGETGTDLYPLGAKTVRHLRETAEFAELSTGYGHGQMREVGNLYSASLPAWMAAGLEEAAAGDVADGTQRVLAIGYGSGDAAELIPMELVEGWQHAAANIHFAEALADASDLDESAYLALHAGGETAIASDRQGVFYIDSLGTNASGVNDAGVEYYRYSG